MRRITSAISAIVLGVVAMFGSKTLAADFSPMAVAGAETVDTAKVKALFDAGVVFVDVRNGTDWEAGRIPGSHHLELKSNFNEAKLSGAVAKDKPVVIYCNGDKCLRSSEASAAAVGWGFKVVKYYRDGIPAWKSAGHPTE